MSRAGLWRIARPDAEQGLHRRLFSRFEFSGHIRNKQNVCRAVLELRSDLDLASEPRAVDALDQVGREYFDDDLPAKESVGSDEDPAHASAAKLALDLVGGVERVF